MTSSRRRQAQAVREAAADLAASRPHPAHINNGDEHRHRRVDNKRSYIGNFTKGLPHDTEGFLMDPAHYDDWVKAIDSGDEADFRRLELGPPSGNWRYAWQTRPEVRAWESMGAGLTFDLEGPDAQAVTMPPAPSLDSQELAAEMAEVYWQAICRDIPFSDWKANTAIGQARTSLAKFPWFAGDGDKALAGATDRLATSLARRRVLVSKATNKVPVDQLFRGVTPGETTGPYVSQFLLIGNVGLQGSPGRLDDGKIRNGAILTDQRVRVAEPGRDYLQDFRQFLDAQDGAALGGENYLANPDYRFILTGRDLATYVHYDALYEAYLNACLILLGLGAPEDPGLPFGAADAVDKQRGFAQFGGPHILTLVTEVATRALKAVRYQKFNVHRRPRPEAIAGLVHVLGQNAGNTRIQGELAPLQTLEKLLDGPSGLAKKVEALNSGAGGFPKKGNRLLPMAFPEGSPMHPSYGAGHATVAGACVTILKAWFDAGWVLKDGGSAFAYEAVRVGKTEGSKLQDLCIPLTVEGELNKLGANIAIGRNWAGVHYYTDYIESFRMGEAIAIGLLQEQKLTYGENFSMTVPLFDGGAVRI